MGLVLLAGSLCAPPVRADEARFTIDFLSRRSAAWPVPQFSLELAGSRGGRRLPRLMLVTTDGVPRLTQYGADLPRLTIGRLSFVPQFGDQRVAVDFLAASLAGMAVDARPLRGVGLTAEQGRVALAIAVGQVGAHEAGFASLVPRALAVTSAIKVGRGLALAPRFTSPLTRAGVTGSTPVSTGVSARGQLWSHVTVVGDVGAARSISARWAPTAAAGVMGDWRRGAFEVSTRRADERFSLLGPVGFAGQDAAQFNGRVVVARGVTLVGSVGAIRPHDRRRHDAGSTANSLTVRIERPQLGALIFGRDQSADRSRRGVDSMKVEWQRTHAGWATTARLFVRREQLAQATLPAFRELFLQVQRTPGSGRLVCDARTTVALSDRPAGTPRLTSRMTSHLTLSRRLSVSTEGEWAALGGALAMRHLRVLRVAADVMLNARTSLRVAYDQAPGAQLRLVQRLEARLVRTVEF